MASWLKRQFVFKRLFLTAKRFCDMLRLNARHSVGGRLSKCELVPILGATSFHSPSVQSPTQYALRSMLQLRRALGSIKISWAVDQLICYRVSKSVYRVRLTMLRNASLLRTCEADYLYRISDFFCDQFATLHLRAPFVLVQSEIGQRSIKFKGCRLWNNLPAEIKIIQSFSSFKYNLKKTTYYSV